MRHESVSIAACAVDEYIHGGLIYAAVIVLAKLHLSIPHKVQSKICLTTLLKENAGPGHQFSVRLDDVSYRVISMVAAPVTVGVKSNAEKSLTATGNCNENNRNCSRLKHRFLHREPRRSADIF